MTCCKQHLSQYLEGQCHSMTLQQNCVRTITLLCKVGFYKYLTSMITIFGWHVSRNILVATLKVKVTGWPCTKIVYGPSFCYLKLDFTIISHKWSPYSDDMSRVTFWSLPWRSRSQHDLAAKSCPAQNFDIWSPILKLLHRNDHHIEKPCRKQHLGRYLEGKGHSMTLQQKRVWTITLLFEVGFYNYLT